MGILSLSSGMRLRLVYTNTPTPASGRARPAKDAFLTAVDLWARTKEKPVAEWTGHLNHACPQRHCHCLEQVECLHPRQNTKRKCPLAYRGVESMLLIALHLGHSKCNTLAGSLANECVGVALYDSADATIQSGMSEPVERCSHGATALRRTRVTGTRRSPANRALVLRCVGLERREKRPTSSRASMSGNMCTCIWIHEKKLP